MTKDKVKNIALLVLTGLFIVFFALWFFNRSKPEKDANELLQAKIDSIQKQRDSLMADVQIREQRVNRLEDSIREGERRLFEIDIRLQRVTEGLIQANSRVNTAMTYRNSLEQKLAALQKSPRNREGDALIFSLKDKLESK